MVLISHEHDLTVTQPIVPSVATRLSRNSIIFITVSTLMVEAEDGRDLIDLKIMRQFIDLSDNFIYFYFYIINIIALLFLFL